MHTWYMHVIQRDFDVNFNNPFLFFLTTYVISTYVITNITIIFEKKKEKLNFNYSLHTYHTNHTMSYQSH